MQELKFTPLFTDANLTAYYRMESGALAVDSGPNGKTLTNNSVTDGVGKISGCGNFDKTNSYFSIAESVINVSGDFSIALWVKSSGTQNTYACPLSRGHNGYTGFALQFNFPASNSLSLIYGDGGAWRGLDFSYNPNTDFNWHFLVITRTGNTLSIYKDNSLVTSSNSYAPSFGTFNLSIGQDTANTDSNHRRWYGLIDDVAIFSKVLSATEMGYLYGIGTKKIMGIAQASVKNLIKIPNTSIKKFMGVSNI